MGGGGDLWAMRRLSAESMSEARNGVDGAWESVECVVGDVGEAMGDVGEVVGVEETKRRSDGEELVQAGAPPRKEAS